VLIPAGLLSFLNAVVIHNHLHRGIFHSHRLNMIWRGVLSFGALYPASANVPSHNLVHHHFGDDGQPDWADPQHVRFRWNLLNLIHFPNIAGPNTFAGVGKWAATTRQASFGRQYLAEMIVAFGLTGGAAAVRLLAGAAVRGAAAVLRGALHPAHQPDPARWHRYASEWNHSRNFVGRGSSIGSCATTATTRSTTIGPGCTGRSWPRPTAARWRRASTRASTSRACWDICAHVCV
jgi:beta-carotene hydroxylase